MTVTPLDGQFTRPRARAMEPGWFRIRIDIELPARAALYTLFLVVAPSCQQNAPVAQDPVQAGCGQGLVDVGSWGADAPRAQSSPPGGSIPGDQCPAGALATSATGASAVPPPAQRAVPPAPAERLEAARAAVETARRVLAGVDVGPSSDPSDILAGYELDSMRRLLDEAVDRGETVAVLLASSPGGADGFPAGTP